jgi:RimJ/RimL family protein N-acetyltransferase
MEAVEESREHLRPWMPFWDDHRTLERAVQFCAESRAAWVTRHHLFLRITRRDDGRHLGGTGFQEIAWDVPRFEIGYWVRASEEGKGYVSEAVRLLTRFGFERLGARRIEIRCDPTNVRSVRVAERAGYRLEATLRDHARRNDGSLRDTRVYALLAGEPRAEGPPRATHA